MAAEILGYELTEELPVVGVSIWNIFMFCIVLIIGILIVKLISLSLTKTMKKSGVDEILIKFTTKVLRVLLYIFVFGIALAFLGVNLGAALVSISVVLGFVLGFALEGTLSNIAAGFMISVTKPFKKDDYVSVNGVEGSIKIVGINTTEMDTPDNKHIIIPNKLVWSANIINYTRNNMRRVDMEVGVSYKADLNKVMTVTMHLLNTHKKVLKKPEPQVAVKEMGESAVKLVVRPWVKTADYWDVFFEMKKSLKESYDRTDIKIPYPQMDLHIVEKK